MTIVLAICLDETTYEEAPIERITIFPHEKEIFLTSLYQKVWARTQTSDLRHQSHALP